MVNNNHNNRNDKQRLFLMAVRGNLGGILVGGSRGSRRVLAHYEHMALAKETPFWVKLCYHCLSHSKIVPHRVCGHSLKLCLKKAVVFRLSLRNSRYGSWRDWLIASETACNGMLRWQTHCLAHAIRKRLRCARIRRLRCDSCGMSVDRHSSVVSSRLPILLRSPFFASHNLFTLLH